MKKRRRRAPNLSCSRWIEREKKMDEARARIVQAGEFEEFEKLQKVLAGEPRNKELRQYYRFKKEIERAKTFRIPRNPGTEFDFAPELESFVCLPWRVKKADEREYTTPEKIEIEIDPQMSFNFNFAPKIKVEVPEVPTDFIIIPALDYPATIHAYA